MRFDYFENFWNEYKVFFENIQIKKEILKQVYHYNAELLIPTKKPILMDAFSGQEYEVINDAESLIIKPYLEKQENYKMIAITSDFIKIFSQNIDSIIIEKYDYKKGNINLKCYDSKTLDFLADNDYIITFDPTLADKQMNKLHISPDFEIDTTLRPLTLASLADNKSTDSLINVRTEKNGEPYESFTKTCEVDNIYSCFQKIKNNFDLSELLNGKNKS